MNNALFAPVISAFLYMLYLLSIGLIEYDNARILIKRYRLRHRLSRREEKSAISSKASDLLSGVFGKNIDGVWLIAFCLMVFISAFLIAFRSFNIPAALLIALSCASIPLLLLLGRLQKVRNKGGKESINLVTEIYRQYKMNDRNIFVCLEKCIEGDGTFRVTKKHLYLLLLKLRESSSKEDIKSACNRFAFSVGGVWGRMLSACIEEAVYFGTDISEGLLDIVDQLRQAEKLLEERKRLNSEATRMTLFLVPFLYIATVFVSIKYLGMSIGEYIHNQFLTPEGVLFLIISVFLFVVNIVLINFTGSERMDY